jgi:hypothetical protein
VILEKSREELRYVPVFMSGRRSVKKGWERLVMVRDFWDVHCATAS